MAFSSWFRPPRHVLTVFLAVAIVSAGALVWLVVLLLEQDKTVARQRRQDQLEQAADRATAIMQASLANLELQIATDAARAGPPPPGITILNVDRGRIVIRPTGSLLYHAGPAENREAPPALFRESEQAEFIQKDLAAAAGLYSKLAADENAAVRAGALVRLARVQRKMGNAPAALEAYDRLFQLSGYAIAGLPAGLIASEGRARVFEETHRESELRREAAALRDDLVHARWPLTKSQYESYSAEAGKWLASQTRSAEEAGGESDAVSRSDAATWLWENRHEASPMAQLLVETDSGSAFVIWRGISEDSFNAAIAGPAFLEKLCREAVPDMELRCVLSNSEGTVVIGEQPSGRVAAMRTETASKLPWTLQVFPAPGDRGWSASPQRALLMSVFAVLIVVWSSGAYFIVRAISREMRVARLQSDFVAAVSHEFRSPLSTLRQISEMLVENRVPSEEERRETYSVMARESERLHRLVEDLLDFGRFDAGAAVYHFAPLEIRGFLLALVAEFQKRVASSGYRVELSLPDADAYVRADAEALSIAVFNLLDNAVKYSPECLTVWVEVEADQRRVSIAVSDRGLGIPLHEQRDIFEKFVRGTESKALRIKGTGIGLAMVRQVIHAHGGEIRVVSEPGQGSRFTMLLDATGGVS